ncbi:Hypothetical predicted protein [Mytilus galloprovincialis]|uniref:Uncharacterized protein n=1 Tax=Mytilus galloprovincialis TaxID=29158 RepID=A0A8B6D0P9_MYTGA|nr:Hypothetical predicted protein [Mytilus galloprovincialis]
MASWGEERNACALFYLQKLCIAAGGESIKDVELSLKNGANLEYKSGKTPYDMVTIESFLPDSEEKKRRRKKSDGLPKDKQIDDPNCRNNLICDLLSPPSP